MDTDYIVDKNVISGYAFANCLMLLQNAMSMPDDYIEKHYGSDEGILATAERYFDFGIKVMKTMPECGINRVSMRKEKDNGWVPVEKGLPKDKEKEYQISVYDRNEDISTVYKGFYSDEEWWTQWCHGCKRISDYKSENLVVTAWKPLDEPYEYRDGTEPSRS